MLQSDWLSDRTLLATGACLVEEAVFEMAKFFSFLQSFERTF